MSKVIIIGAGPAGVSAALYTLRSGIETTIISHGSSSLGKAEKIENYYGMSAPVSGADLFTNGLEGAKRLGAKLLEEEVVGLSYMDSFTVKTNRGEYEADCVLLATGAPRKSAKIEGIQKFEGAGVSYCAVCDGFFYRGKPVAVLGNGEFALHEAETLLPLAQSVTLLTNGAELTVSVPDNIQVDKRKIAAFTGESAINAAAFEDGATLPIAGVFIAYGTAGSTALARTLGALTEGNKILVNDKMETNIPGLYAAGDCVGGLMQVSKAVGEGAAAGTEMIRFMKQKTSV